MWCACTVVAIVVVAVFYILGLLLRSLKISKITDKYVFVTGCDSGFGRHAAIRLDQLGFHVFAGCLTKEGAKSLSETASSRLATVILDVGSNESIEQAVQLVKQSLPPDQGLWGLINNAGICGLFCQAEFCNREAVLATLNINLLGLMEMTRYFLPLIRKSRGRVVNTASVAGRLAFVPAPYTTSKFAVEGFSDILRREVNHQGIKVCIVEPGSFQTSILNVDKVVDEFRNALRGISPEVQAVYNQKDLVEEVRNNMLNILDTGSPNLNLVADAYIHAVTSKFPRTRYVVGTDAKWFYIPVTYLPDYIADFILYHTIFAKVL